MATGRLGFHASSEFEKTKNKKRNLKIGVLDRRVDNEKSA